MTLRPVVVGLLAGIIALTFAVSEMVSNDTDASYFLATGELHPIREYVEDRLGDDIFLRQQAGHDGKFAFLQAHDLLITDPDTYDLYMERPVYRLQRQVLPALAAPFLIFGEWSLVWGLLAINLGAVAVGAWAIARIAADRDLPTWLGLAFVANPGVFSSIVAGTADTLAWALAAVGIHLYMRRHVAGASLALLASALSREAMLIVVAGLLFDAWSKRDRAWLLPFATPFAAVAVWAIFVRLRLDVPLTTTQSKELGTPFVGLWEALGDWLGDGFGADTVMSFLTVVIIGVFFLLIWELREDLLIRATAGFALLSPFLTAAVWEGFFDISRAVAPIFTVLIILMWERLFAGASDRPLSEPIESD